MADKIRKIDYFSMQTADRAGEGLRLLSALRDAGIGLLAFTGFPSGRRVQMDFVPEDSAAFIKAARKLGLALSPKKSGFIIEGKDRVGAIVNTLAKLAKAGISVVAMDAVCAGKGRFGAIFWVKPAEVERVAKLLRAA
ncbi:MAG: hypothetical protein ACREUA_07495 [Burkholderiales bacterium]